MALWVVLIGVDVRRIPRDQGIHVNPCHLRSKEASVLPRSEERQVVAPNEDGEPVRRISYGEYIAAVALVLARRHRPVWSWRKQRQVCRCGADLPCRARLRIQVNRGRWEVSDGR